MTTVRSQLKASETMNGEDDVDQVDRVTIVVKTFTMLCYCCNFCASGIKPGVLHLEPVSRKNKLFTRVL
jgi:hypothetical protein